MKTFSTILAKWQLFQNYFFQNVQRRKINSYGLRKLKNCELKLYFLQNREKVQKLLRILKKGVCEKNRFSTFPKKVMGFGSSIFLALAKFRTYFFFLMKMYKKFRKCLESWKKTSVKISLSEQIHLNRHCIRSYVLYSPQNAEQ